MRCVPRRYTHAQTYLYVKCILCTCKYLRHNPSCAKVRQHRNYLPLTNANLIRYFCCTEFLKYFAKEAPSDSNFNWNFSCRIVGIIWGLKNFCLELRHFQGSSFEQIKKSVVPHHCGSFMAEMMWPDKKTDLHWEFVYIHYSGFAVFFRFGRFGWVCKFFTWPHLSSIWARTREKEAGAMCSLSKWQNVG